MLVKTVLWTRATILLLLGVAIIVSTFYKGHTEPETETEKKATTILLSLVGTLIVTIGIANVVFSITPKIETQEYELVGLSKKLFFETPCTFENEKDTILLTVPISVAQSNMEDLLTEGSHYVKKKNKRSRVVIEIYEVT